MPLTLKLHNVTENPLTSIFFLIDTSGRMYGQPIEAVNTAMSEAILEVMKYVQNPPDVTIRYNVLEFNTDAKWMYAYPCNIEDFKWINLQADGLRSLGTAYEMLNEKLSRNNGFLQEHLNNAPIIILLLSGTPTDNVDSGYASLKENKWFQVSTRIAIELRETEDFDCNHSTLVEFAGEKGVLPVGPEKLKQYLKNIAISVSVIGCRYAPRCLADIELYPKDVDDYEDDDPVKSILECVNNLIDNSYEILQQIN